MKAKKQSGKQPANRDLEFLYEMGTLMNMDRAWRQNFGVKCASDLEHSYRVLFIALLLARMEGGADEALVMKMALMHDLPETRTGDVGYVQKVYVVADEERAARDMLLGTSFSDFFEVFRAYEKRDSLEAKLVKDADNLDIDIELRELTERGSLLPEKLKGTRKLVRDKKLHTKSAKKLWDLIQKSDVASWHLAANKWVKLPNTGR